MFQLLFWRKAAKVVNVVKYDDGCGRNGMWDWGTVRKAGHLRTV